MTLASATSAPEVLIWNMAAASNAEPVEVVTISMRASVRAPLASITVKAAAKSGVHVNGERVS